jgi:predicted alpha-1,2-mannosidase
MWGRSNRRTVTTNGNPGSSFSRRRILQLTGGLGVGGIASIEPASGKYDPKKPEPHAEPVDHVDPLVGTTAASLADADGAMPYANVFPGPTAPHGMVQLSPDTGFNVGGYHYEDPYIEGFSHTHLSGTGCYGLGNFLVTATTGDLRTREGRTSEQYVPDSGYRSRFSHETETAEPGYYSVLLEDYDVRAELTATERVGVHRYTFPETDSGHVLLDVTHTLASSAPFTPSNPVEGEVEIVDDRTMVGSITVALPFCSTIGGSPTSVSRPIELHVAARFSRSFDSAGVWESSLAIEDARRARGPDVGAFADYATDAGEEILVAVGVSYVSQANALENLEAEAPDLDFDRVREETRAKWNRRLSRVEVEGGTPAERVTFYTALYRSMLGPTIFEDVNGEYVGMDDAVRVTDDYTRYQMFSLWDTFRGQHPLMTVVEPEIQQDAMRSLVGMYEEGGWLPKWAYANRYTNVMIADHATSVLAESIEKGLDDFDIETAFEAMVKNATEKPLPYEEFEGRKNLTEYEEHGYVPHDTPRNGAGVQDHIPHEYERGFSERTGYPASYFQESASCTLEFAYCDWALSRVADRLGESDVRDRFRSRARNFEHLFDPETKWIRPRNENGSWMTPFDPTHWAGFTEANSWVYTWFVPHDVGWLVDQLGRERFVDRLDHFFESFVYPGWDEAFSHYWHGNEPDQHVPYLYNWVGQPWKTQRTVQDVLAGLYAPTPGGVPGNEDVGQLSAWYVLSAMGFYPVAPVRGTYQLASPLFDRVTISLSDEYYDGETFVIETTGEQSGTDSHRYVQSARMDGERHDQPWFHHDAIDEGATLELVMGPTPSEWGTEPSSRPPSMSETH